MPFDLSTAREIEAQAPAPVNGGAQPAAAPASGGAQPAGFDLATAQAVQETPEQVISRIPGMDESIVPAEPPPGPGVGERAIGAGEAALTLLSGATTGAGQQIAAFTQTLLEQIAQGNFGSKEAADIIEQSTMRAAEAGTRTPRTEAGRSAIETVGNVLEPMAAIAPLAETAQLARAVQQRPPASIRAAISAPVEEAVSTVQRAVSGPKGRQLMEVRPQTGKLAAIADTIKKDPYNAEAAGYRLLGEKAVEDPLANAAIKQGWKPGVIASIKASSPQDIKQMIGMLNIFKLGKKSEKFRAANRPADVLGKTIEERVKFLSKTKSEAGKEVNKAAQDLRNTPVDHEPAIQQFVKDLEDIGVVLETKDEGGLKAILRGSDIEGDRTSKALLNRILERLSETDEPKSGYDLHRAKQYLDTQLDFGKRAKDALSGKTERIVKKLRHNLNEALRENSPEYKAANDKFSATTGAIDDFKKAVGSKIDLDSQNIDKALGQASRKLLSNYQSRVQLTDALDMLESTAKKYGFEINDNILNQLITVNEIDRMFGAPASMTFKGQIQEALQTGVQAARSGMAENAINLAKTGIEKARGINEENAITAIEQLLKRELSRE